MLRGHICWGFRFLGGLLSGGLGGQHAVLTNAMPKEDAIIGLIFSSFLAGAVYGVIKPDIRKYSDHRPGQYSGNRSGGYPATHYHWHCLSHRAFFKWKDLMVTFFDENHARAIGLYPGRLKILFFTTAGGIDRRGIANGWAFLVISCLVVTLAQQHGC